MSYTPEMILKLREEKKEMRNRDFALSIGISEAELIAAYCTIGKAKKLRVDIFTLLDNAPKVGTVMALTRNKHAVHERTGCFETIIHDQHIPMALGEIGLRIFPKLWKFGFEYEMMVFGKLTKSLQFFDKHGIAIFKVYSQDTTNMEEWNSLVEKLLDADQSPVLDILSPPIQDQCNTTELDIKKSLNHLKRSADTQQLCEIISELQTKCGVVKYSGNEFAEELREEAFEMMLKQTAQQEIPITCIVGNQGCIQIFNGTIQNIKQMGPWLNILEQKFHMHMLVSGIHKVWRVRKPTNNGYISSLEVFDKTGEMIIQFFNLQQDTKGESEKWRSLLNSLPLHQETAVV
ncbi:ChuX/HutX family heme-like substrate-binding protein [Bartonella sp. F02]|uniref:ChuX/HutX family heme-like substrate-binding protein n=1 Tax=Bartonella sp. F02 TaxID=2967262 RepID=UPI0022A98BD0|nr:ChuX/HutX family heme-like substrate-binding protein [Bartonella sp. F02]MCZ2328520.1 hemin-degrading factor [Bartonella sp. F02]